METQVLKLEAPELEVIEKSKAEKIKAIFVPMTDMLGEFESAHASIIKESSEGITLDTVEKAKRLRLDIAKIRINAEKARKSEKDEYLRAGKAIDGVANILKWAVTEKENQLKEIEDYFTNQEKERLEKLQAERVEMIAPYVEDPLNLNLGEMQQDVWEAYYQVKKKAHEDLIEAQKIAEENRIKKEKAEEAERKRIKKENKRLEKEAKEREAKIQAEREEREKAEQDRLAEIKKEQEEKEKEYQKNLEKERAEKKRLQDEARAKEEAERKEQERIAAEEEARKQAGDSDKKKELIADLQSIAGKYEFKSKANQKMLEGVLQLLDKVISYIQNN